MNPQITIRRATLTDAAPITSLVCEAYSPYISRIGKKPAPMLDDYRQVITDARVFVLTKGPRLMGVLVLDLQKTTLLLENIAVLPACKGQGAGKALMAFCEDQARELGCEVIELYTHVLMVENQEIYKMLGYQETHRTTQNGFARVFMRKLILPR